LSLKDSIPFSPKIVPDGPVRPYWVVEGFPEPAEEAILFRLEAPIDLSLKVTPPRAKASDVVKLRAQQFGRLLKAGYKPGEAAHRLHTTVRELMSKEHTQNIVKEIVEGYTLDAAARKLLQRALVNKMVIENAGKEGDQKALVDALKLMADDSELEIKKPVTNNFNVGLPSELKSFLDSAVPVAELAPPVEGETEDLGPIEEGPKDR